MNLKILMLENSPEDAEFIERTLRKSAIQFTSAQADSKASFIEKIITFQPDVILSDHSLPQINSIEALRLCKVQGLFIPFILVTAFRSEEFVAECLKLGADDHLLKSNLLGLTTSIENALNQRQLIEKSKRDIFLFDH